MPFLKGAESGPIIKYIFTNVQGKEGIKFKGEFDSDYLIRPGQDMRGNWFVFTEDRIFLISVQQTGPPAIHPTPPGNFG